MLLGSLSEKSCDLVGVLAEVSAFALFCLAVIAVLFECCFAWMLWKLERIDGDPVLRETRIWATWEYVSSVGGGQQGMVGLCAHCGCGKLVVHHRPTAT